MTAVLIDLSNYDVALKQSTASRSGSPNGNVYFNKSTGKIEFITKQELPQIDLGSGMEDNPLDVTLGIKFEAIYAFENQERASDEDLRKYNRWTSGTFKFGGAYNFVNSRKPSLAGDRAIIRGSGWNEYASDGGVDRIYFGNKGLSNIGVASQPYYQLSSGGAPVNYAKAGQIDEAVQVYGSKGNTPSDSTAYAGSAATPASQTISVVKAAGTFTRVAGSYLSDGFEVGHRFIAAGLALNLGTYTVAVVTALVITIVATEWASITNESGGGDEQLTVNGFDTRTYEAASIRTFGKNYDRKVTTTDLGIAELGGYSTGFAVNESVHLTTGAYALADVYGAAKISPWGLNATKYMTLEEKVTPVVISGFNEADGTFTWVLNNPQNGNLNQMVAFLDALSQTDDDINEHATNVTRGKRVGTWYSYNAEGKVVTRSGADVKGLYLYNVPVADQQRVVFTDDAAGLKTYPFSVSVEAEVGAIAKADVKAWYHGFFAASYNTSGAVTIEDSGDVEVKGMASTANGANKIIFPFDYDGDTVGGPAGTDKNCVFLCEGDGGATQAKTLFTITKITTVAFACAPTVENNV